MLCVANGEKARIADALLRFKMLHTWVDENMQAQSDIGLAFIAELKAAAPRIVRALERARDGHLDAVYIDGLPKDVESARIVLVAMTHILGKPFNYDAQNGGALVMKLKPVRGSVGNTNSTREDFAFHTDDAAIPRDARVEWLQLYGIVNPPNTLTGFAPTMDALNDLKASGTVDPLVKALGQPRFRVRFPVSFGFEKEVWSDPCPVIEIGKDGDIETRFPSYAIKPVRDDDFVAHAAIAVFLAALERQVINVPLDAGCFLAFNNNRGAHKRGTIGEGDRLVLRTYATQCLDMLQAVTGENGPIFPVAPFAKALSA
tara:strand:- start:1557 stop:2504 length:948 start_codon:yes stop_codon:yes gene_type:complete